jgi:L-iditol 2-dehydrogenase
MDVSDFRLDLAREFGADYTVNVRKTPLKERMKFVKDRTEGRGADVVIETTGTPHVLAEGLDMLRRGGTYLEASNFVDAGEATINVHRHLAAKNVLLIGSTNHPNTEYDRTMKMMMRHRHNFPWSRFISHQFKLEEATRAMEASFEDESLKVVFVP